MKTRIALAVFALSAVSLAQAGDFGHHPAVKTRAASIDASTLMYGHPASPLNQTGHANFDHPAVSQRGVNELDASTMMYGHPASPRNGAGTGKVTVAGTNS